MQRLNDHKGKYMASSFLWFTLITVAALSGCAKWEDRARSYLASSVDVFAVVGGKLMQGQAQIYGDRTGTIAIGTGLAVSPAQSCSGRMTLEA